MICVTKTKFFFFDWNFFLSQNHAFLPHHAIIIGKKLLVKLKQSNSNEFSLVIHPRDEVVNQKLELWFLSNPNGFSLSNHQNSKGSKSLESPWSKLLKSFEHKTWNVKTWHGKRYCPEIWFELSSHCFLARANPSLPFGARLYLYICIIYYL